ncbi:PAS domain S-box protein [Laspinema sp. A4]|uniref:PAS domain S-box protein n=1 Tax=Laspinema sp. D2d TaxID=2953686 RepID=UPI0021BA3FE2|nr:PAS domain S-box protein [Laspinema sp. D2d]MCT7983927.1 PAS domain S-box protein [Laspinema sp. D2d]
MIWVAISLTIGIGIGLGMTRVIPGLSLAIARKFPPPNPTGDSPGPFEAQFLKLIAQMDVGVVLTGPESEVLVTNPVALTLLSLDQATVIGKPLFDEHPHLLQEDCTPFAPGKCPVMEAIATHSPTQVIIGVGAHSPLTPPLSGIPDFHLFCDLELDCQKWLLVHANPQIAPNGRVEQVLCTFSNITQQKRAEASLRRRENRLRQYSRVLGELAKSPSLNQGDLQASLEQITVAVTQTLNVERASIWLYTEDRRAIHCIELYERSPQKHSAGIELRAIDYPVYFQTIEQERIVAADVAQEDPTTLEFTEGYLIPLGITSMLDAPIRVGGQMVGVICLEHIGPSRQWRVEEENFAASVADCIALGLEARDRAQARLNLEKALDRLQAVLDTVPGCVSWIRSDLRYIGVNRYLANLFGRSPSDFVNHSVGFLQTRQEFPNFLQHFFESSIHKTTAEIGLDIEGNLRHYLIGVEKYNQGNSAVCVGIDITDLKETEQALRQERALLRSLIDSIPDLIFYKDKQRIYQRVNKAFQVFAAREESEIIGKTDDELFPAEAAKICGEIDRQILAEGQLVRKEEKLNELEGKTTWLETIQTPFFDLNGEIVGMIGISRDITERKTVETTLQQSKDELERRVEERTAFLKEANDRLQVEIAHREQVQIALKASQDKLRQCLIAARMGTWDWDILNHKLTGSAEMEALYGFVPGAFDGKYDTYLQAIDPDDRNRVEEAIAEILSSSSERFEIEQRIRLETGELRWLSAQGEVIRDATGQAIRSIGTVMDISDRKEAQLALQEAAYAAETANRSKSMFLANMSHELRTPLNAIIGYSEMLQEEADDVGYTDLIPDLEKIRTAGNHLLVLINDILDISKIEAGKMDLYLEDFDVNELIENVIITAQPLIERNDNTLQVECDRNLGIMYADLTKVRQILLNLLSNAAKFTKNGQITLTVVLFSPPKVPIPCALPETYSSWIQFAIADTGIGITPEQRQHLFKPFMQGDASTTREYGGTGLGLAISQRFCEMMGGEISVESQPLCGSRFTVILPCEVVDP